MARTKIHTCYHYRCKERPVVGGLCQKHYDEDQAKALARNEAINVIQTYQVDKVRLTSLPLLEEIKRVADWWHRAGRALQVNREDDVLRDETQYAPEWCIAIAGIIVQQERDHRLGKEPDTYQEQVKQFSWDRFEALAAGLMSNGVPRPKR
jgi:hypothetical protein